MIKLIENIKPEELKLQEKNIYTFYKNLWLKIWVQEISTVWRIEEWIKMGNNSEKQTTNFIYSMGTH
jgi:hypothetical protein